MWLCFNNAFVSVVRDVEDPTGKSLLVRARKRTHLMRLLGRGVKITETPKRDYRWRDTVPRDTLSRIMDRHCQNLEYDNFKNSVAREGSARHVLDVVVGPSSPATAAGKGDIALMASSTGAPCGRLPTPVRSPPARHERWPRLRDSVRALAANIDARFPYRNHGLKRPLLFGATAAAKACLAC